MSEGKKLIDYDPRTLDLVQLTVLENALMAKVILVSNEAIKRYTKLIEATKGTQNGDEACEVFARGVVERIKIVMMLEDKLVRSVDTGESEQKGER